MKKLWIIPLAALVLLGCIFVAGCITPDTPPAVTPTGPGPVIVDEPVLTIFFEKTGLSYNIGDTFKITLPSNPTTGYDWAVTETEGVNITQEFIAPEKVMPGAPGKSVFIIKAEKEGNYPFTLKYMRSWEGEESTISVYNDEMVCAKTDEELLTPRGSVEFVGEVNPAAGKTVKIITSGNPTTGYEWTAKGSDGLTVSEPLYISVKPASSVETQAVGTGGKYAWTVTADKAGTYRFTAEYKRSFETEAVSRYTVDITFIDTVKTVTSEAGSA
ncbi:MAG: protease inhibitor I42 family protein [Methanocorpusculum sp.]|nr:protease inhibitor I42 family protein [Methanocorpusculum sp.]